MIRPYLNNELRNDLKQDTLFGATLRLNIAIKKLQRDLDKKICSFPCFRKANP